MRGCDGFEGEEAGPVMPRPVNPMAEHLAKPEGEVETGRQEVWTMNEDVSQSVDGNSGRW